VAGSQPMRLGGAALQRRMQRRGSSAGSQSSVCISRQLVKSSDSRRAESRRVEPSRCSYWRSWRRRPLRRRRL